MCTLVPTLQSRSIIHTIWVFRNKIHEDSEVICYKAKLVTQGYNQQEGIGYDETYALVAPLEAMKIS